MVTPPVGVPGSPEGLPPPPEGRGDTGGGEVVGILIIVLPSPPEMSRISFAVRLLTDIPRLRKLR